MFVKKDKVLISNPINFGGPSSWKGMTGAVRKVEPGWVHVILNEVADKTPIPFREREVTLVK